MREPSEKADRLANLVIGAAIEVHRELGPGLDEMLYENAMDVELRLLRGYLKITKKELGLLINFNVPVLKDGIQRIVLTN